MLLLLLLEASGVGRRRTSERVTERERERERGRRRARGQRERAESWRERGVCAGGRRGAGRICGERASARAQSDRPNLLGKGPADRSLAGRQAGRGWAGLPMTTTTTTTTTATT